MKYKWKIIKILIMSFMIQTLAKVLINIDDDNLMIIRDKIPKLNNNNYQLQWIQQQVQQISNKIRGEQMLNESLFRIEDINSIIRLFAYRIQERFDEIDGINSRGNDIKHRYFSEDQNDNYDHLVRKYRNYFTYDQKQIRYLDKFVKRILQIIEFFKQRCKNQQLLNYILKKINQKLTKIINIIPIDVECLFSYIIDISKNGFNIKKIQIKPRKQSIKKNNQSYNQKKITQTSIDGKKQNKNQQCRNLRITIATADQTRRRRSLSISAKYQPKTPMKDINGNVESDIAKIYSGLDVDYNHIQKIIGSKNKIKIQKDCIKSNASVLTSIQVYDKMYSFSYVKKKDKTDLTLREVHNQKSGRPASNNWVSRKKKIQYKKKRMDFQNISFL